MKTDFARKNFAEKRLITVELGRENSLASTCANQNVFQTSVYAKEMSS